MGSSPGVGAEAAAAVSGQGRQGAAARDRGCALSGRRAGLCATIASIKEPNDPQTGKPKTDIRNVDPSKRNRPIVGVQIFTGLRAEGANKWSGQIYNPEDGKTYDANVVLENANTLKVQGCVLFICKTKTWTRKG